jgi:N-acetylglucosaminyl-diphospho-decaprenol L-rhamnosyltransferase
MSEGARASVIVPTVTPARVARLLHSLRDAGDGFETIVVDNGTGAPELERATGELGDARVLRLGSNQGYSRAVNRAAREARGDALVLLNDDSVVDPGFVDRITEVLDPEAGTVMAAGVMRDSGAPELIETAGVELDRTLLAYDYLNGEPVSVLDGPVADPVGPSGAAAAFTRSAFLEVGGFDEALFAYLEDIDLMLRLRRAGGSCRLAKRAQGVHEHSATLGPGSPRKNYLAGFGRGYVMRKWGVLTPGRLPAVIARELAVCGGQAIADRNLAGVRGRVRGLRAARPSENYPGAWLPPDAPSFASTLRRRLRRRATLRRRED